MQHFPPWIKNLSIEMDRLSFEMGPCWLRRSWNFVRAGRKYLAARHCVIQQVSFLLQKIRKNKKKKKKEKKKKNEWIENKSFRWCFIYLVNWLIFLVLTVTMRLRCWPKLPSTLPAKFSGTHRRFTSLRAGWTSNGSRSTNKAAWWNSARGLTTATK